MIKEDSGNHSVSVPSRALVLQSTLTLLSLPCVANTTTAWVQETLAGSGEVVVVSYDDSFTDGVRWR